VSSIQKSELTSLLLIRSLPVSLYATTPQEIIADIKYMYVIVILEYLFVNMALVQ